MVRKHQCIDIPALLVKSENLLDQDPARFDKFWFRGVLEYDTRYETLSGLAGLIIGDI